MSDVEKLNTFNLYIFGGTGDLANRKLLPALFRQFILGSFSDQSNIIGIGTKELSEEDSYINLIVSKLNKISNKNYSLILDEIVNTNKQYHNKIETSFILSNTIFNKSMDENIYSNLYAKLIYKNNNIIINHPPVV